MKQLSSRSALLFVLRNFIKVFLITLLFLIIGWGLFKIYDSNQHSKTLEQNALNGTLILQQLLNSWIWVILSLTLIVTSIWSYLLYLSYKYQIDDKGFHLERGVLTKKYTSIPFKKIQSVDIERDVMNRILGLSDIKIVTAGTFYEDVYSEGYIPGLLTEEAENLREELLSKSGLSKREVDT